VENYPLWWTLFFEHTEYIIVRVAIVNHQSLTKFLCECDMSPEAVLLNIALLWWSAKVIEASLANGSHPRMLSQCLDFGQGAFEVWQARGIIGMKGNRGHHLTREGGGALDRISRRREVAAHLHNAIDTDRSGSI
jgi:hypothetical protein